MDIPSHILDAVNTDSSPSSPRRGQPHISSQRRTPTYNKFAKYQDSNSSADDISTTSSEHEHDYTTDLTTPAASESCPEDMQPDDVEDFRDREYPQLKGKTYLDHGGTTVCRASMKQGGCAQWVLTLDNSSMPNRWSRNSPLI